MIKTAGGRANEEITGLLIEGMRQVKPDMPLRIISDEIEAVEFAMKHAQKNEWIFVSTDDVRNTIAYVTRAHENKTMDYAKSPVAGG